MSCGALQCGSYWEARCSLSPATGAQCSSRKGSNVVVRLSSKFLGIRLSASTPAARHPINGVATHQAVKLKIECMTPGDFDFQPDAERWLSRIASSREQQRPAAQEPIASVPERGTTAGAASPNSEHERATSARAITTTIMVPVVQGQKEINDWRSFRAKLCLSEAGVHCRGDSRGVTSHEEEFWAHRLSALEAGCVLIARDDMKHSGLLRGSVVLVLGGTKNHWHGIVLNKQMYHPVHQGYGDPRVLLDLAGCPKYAGGPKPKISLLSGRANIRGFLGLLPGLAVGDDAAVPTVVSAVGSGEIPRDEIHVFVGQVEWESWLLQAEIEAFEWWDVAACSGQMVLRTPPAQLRQTLLSLLADSS
ncbi:hypothetical protein R1flu_001680 [Riccia fluitans]|uniref:Uncharacterized protein n=1 Tax=Riccia fluitans TaxID=41844 RepID=A0ABD1Y443_9MARC